MSDWKPIVSCPTDESVHMMRLPDGTEFVGRWGISQQRWQKRTGPELIRDPHAGVGERVIWSNLAEGIYPSEYKSL